MSSSGGIGELFEQVALLAAREHRLEQAWQHHLIVGAIGAGLAQLAFGGNRIARAQQQIAKFGANLTVLRRHGDAVLQIDDRCFNVAFAQRCLRLFDHVAQARALRYP